MRLSGLLAGSTNDMGSQSCAATAVAKVTAAGAVTTATVTAVTAAAGVVTAAAAVAAVSSGLHQSPVRLPAHEYLTTPIRC